MVFYIKGVEELKGYSTVVMSYRTIFGSCRRKRRYIIQEGGFIPNLTYRNAVLSTGARPPVELFPLFFLYHELDNINRVLLGDHRPSVDGKYTEGRIKTH